MRSWVLRWVAGVLLLATARGWAWAGHPDQPGAIAVVVGSRSAIGGVTLDTLREIYLRRQRVWPDGSAVLAVNLPADDSVRERFSRRVLGRRPTDLESHWRRLYFDGVKPPAILRTPRAVCAFVAVESSAIGYVPLADVEPGTCRVVLTVDAPE